MIYLDNAATTPPFEAVIERMTHFYTQAYFNPSALYAPAFDVKKQIDAARAQILQALGGSGKLCFTSCATESNAWIFACGRKQKKGNVVISAGEHASVHENAQALISQGVEVRTVRLCADGRVDEADFAQKTDENTALISVLHCSNETGAVNDVARLCAVAKEKNPQVLFHSDGVQAFGKMSVDCRALGIDAYSLSAHKIGGPKGVGALWLRDGLQLAPMLRGGGQEEGNRSGTENVAGIVGFATAVDCAKGVDRVKIAALKQSIAKIVSAIGGVTVGADGSPFILSLSIEGVKAEILQRLAAQKGILIGLGSACASRSRSNRVLSAMGRTKSQIEGSIRLSFWAQNQDDDGAQIGGTIAETAKKMRK